MWEAAVNLKGCKNKYKGRCDQILYKRPNLTIVNKILANRPSSGIYLNMTYNYLDNLETLSNVASDMTSPFYDNSHMSDDLESDCEAHKSTSSTTCSLLSSPLISDKCAECIGDEKLVISKDSLEIASSLLQLKSNSRNTNMKNFGGRFQSQKFLQSKSQHLLKDWKDPFVESRTVGLVSPFKKRNNQGRPCASSLKVYFCLHETLEDFYCHFYNTCEFQYCSEFEGPVETFVSGNKAKKVTSNLVEFDSSASSLDIFSKLEHIFGVEDLNFIKVWREFNSITRFEVLERPSYCSTEWIKQNVCSPRYKANMKVHLVKKSKNTIKSIYASKDRYREEIENLAKAPLKIIV